MIPQVIWARQVVGVPESPFLPGPAQRPIRITFHDESYADAPAEQVKAVALLRELAWLPEVDAMDTAHGSPAWLQLEYDKVKGRFLPVVVTSRESHRHTALEIPDLDLHAYPQVGKVASWSECQHILMLRDIALAAAHRRLDSDILVTLAPSLLGHRDSVALREANPRTPIEALKIVGLLLRARGNFTYMASQLGRCGLGRGLFYWVLMRHRLPSMWRYFSGCIASSNAGCRGVLGLAQSVFVRSMRALEARDAIGVQFYLPQRADVRDATMYHFDYLTLFLSGAFDIQARVATRAYKIQNPPEHRISFRRQEYLSALRAAGATELYEITTSEPFKDVMTLLHRLRNTIHGEALSIAAHAAMDRTPQSFVRVVPPNEQLLWEAAARLGSAERWGFRQKGEVEFEPYTYSVALVDECLKKIDAIAGATDVALLVPEGAASVNFIDAPPNDREFHEDVRERLDMLG